MESKIRTMLNRGFSLLTVEEKKNLYFLTFFMFIIATLEVVGIASVLPFMDLAMSPEKIDNNGFFLSIIDYFSLSKKEFVISLGILSFLLLLISGIMQIVINKRLYTYTWDLNHTLSYRLITKYLKNDYAFFLDRNSSELTKNIITEVQQVVYGIYLSIVMILSRGIAVSMILLLLLFIDPLVCVLSAIILIGGYVIIYKLIKNIILKQGKIRTEAHEQRFKAISEAIGGIKEVKLMNKEDIFLKNYESPSKRFSDATAKNNIYPIMPKFIMEVIALGGIILVIVLLFSLDYNLNNIIPIATVFAIAGYKLMPSLQMVFKSLSEMKYNTKPLDILYKDLTEEDNNQIKQSDKDFIFNKCIEIKNISFRYSDNTKNVLNNFSLKIPKGKILAIKGTTGSGKTTLIDILLGLLKPNSGQIYIDSMKISENNVKLWQSKISYVPQFIYLIDDTISANIAFGDEKINMDKVYWAAKQAMLEDVIDNLDNGYDTIVGEDGIKLSGGQRQRIGIARALYKKPSLLVLDEATSALDEVTEKAVMDNIYKFSSNCTVIMIAHRLSTIQRADEVIDMSRKV